MLAALLLCSAIVLAAAAPGVALATGDLSSAQDRVGAARLATRAAALAADLADERDDLAGAVAAGQPAASAADRQRTDRQLADVTGGGHLSADLRTALATLPAVRKAALAAATAQAAVAGYQPLIDALGRAMGPVGAPLARATAAASVQRGLLVAGLTASGTQRALVAAAQAARLQEQAALAEFDATAPAALRRTYDRTVTGADTAEADRDLDQLLGGSELTSADRELGTGKVAAALTARLSLMRGVEASAAADEAATAASHRDHQVTVLELRAALAALCLLLLAAVLVTLFRTLTRPLAALHRWSKAATDSGQQAEAIGSDEFAAVARRINSLAQDARTLRARAAELDTERAEAEAAHTALAADHRSALATAAELARTRDDLLRSREELAEQLNQATARNATQVVQVNLALRTLGLIERQLTLIEGMEEHEQEPDRLATLFRLDHLATRMRRNSENMLLLTGTEHSHGATARPVPLIDVARAAISEVERYERVRVLTMPEAEVAGRAADDIGHLIAELLDNATAFSPPESEVHLNGWVMESGEVMVAVEDAGIGVPAERIDGLNALLAEPDPAAPGAAAGLGLYVVARLAHRHGVRVQLRPHANGGATAVVMLPRLLVPSADPLTQVLPAQREGARETAYGTPPNAPAQTAARTEPAASAAPVAAYGPGAESPVPASAGLPSADAARTESAASAYGPGAESPVPDSAGLPSAEVPLGVGPFAVEPVRDGALPPLAVPLVPAQPAAVPPEPAAPGAAADGAQEAAGAAPGGLPPLDRRVRPQPAEPAPSAPLPAQPAAVFAESAAAPAAPVPRPAEPAPPAPPLPSRRPLAQRGLLPEQQGATGLVPAHPADAPAESRVRVERLDVPPAPMPPGAAPAVQVQPLVAETLIVPEPALPSGGTEAARAPLAPAEHMRAERAPAHSPDAPSAPPGLDGPLPRRVRKASGIRAAAQDGRRRTEPLDAEGLRRQLAGLQRGLRDGRRDAALETRGAADHAAPPPAPSASPGETVEEATR
ncbi:nitrate- and nitrite sensing domain-containing protein [Actinacidiphila sp. bgisy145]|uniref:nitrate- and nitrite sensing domain-containing protein n=1 Tax=Actinacidiphila sp. bgisy145 TaxID=3413792 RepID=UPI003EB9A80E